ncbi:hypothetical protein BD414DRAFT_507851 [Trametes punicea]|nr:hypothetical protein BD414DRAFT_507851 [Trametes punicea]
MNHSASFNGAPDTWGTPATMLNPADFVQDGAYAPQEPPVNPFAMGAAQPPLLPAANFTMDQETFQRFLVQAVVNLGSCTEAAEHISGHQLDTLESLRTRLQKQAQQNAELYNKLAQLQSFDPCGLLKVEVCNFNGLANQVIPFLRDMETPIYLFMVKLEKLTQTGSAASYANTFLEYVSYLNWTDEHLKIVCFDQRLKPELQCELLLVKQPPTLHEWVPTVIDVDNKLHTLEASLKERPKGTTSNSTRSDRPKVSCTVTMANPAPHISSVPSGNVVPMEIDAFRQGPLSQAEKDCRHHEGLCLYCGKSGHIISKCPNGAKPRSDIKGPATLGN